MKRQLTTVAVAAFIGFIAACATRYATAPVTAQSTAPATTTSSPSETCEWTYITDRGDPEIGANGQGGTDSEQWGALMRGGWKLKAINPEFSHYIFERCQ